jgi:hypothetical protein
VNKLPNYIPNNDEAFGRFISNAVAQLAQNPAAYAVTATDLANLEAKVSAYSLAFVAAQSPLTRSKVTIAAKRTAKRAATEALQPIYQAIRLNAGIPPQTKVAIAAPTDQIWIQPVAPPSTYPLLAARPSTHLQLLVAWNDSAANISRAVLPYGAAGVAVYAQASSTPLTDPTKIAYALNWTRSPIPIPWHTPDVGKTAYITAAYYTESYTTGPRSPILALTIT